MKTLLYNAQQYPVTVVETTTTNTSKENAKITSSS